MNCNKILLRCSITQTHSMIQQHVFPVSGKVQPLVCCCVCLLSQAQQPEWGHGAQVDLLLSAVKRSIGSTTGCTITEKAPSRAFSWLKAATTAFTFKTLLRQCGLGPWINH